MNKAIKNTIGNYCGPYWSDGKFQSSVVGSKKPASACDECCRVHDGLIKQFGQNDLIDNLFYECTQKRGHMCKSFGELVKFRKLLFPNNQPITKSEDSLIAASKIIHPNRIGPLIMTKSNNNKAKAGAKTAKQTTNNSKPANDSTTPIPVSIATKRTGMAPKIQRLTNGVIVSHRSLLTSVTNSVIYTATQYPVNPGLAQTFPWLYSLAAQYEEYRFKKISFEYRSVCSTATPGVVMMSFDYDALDPAPPSKSAQAQTIPNSENNVWMNNALHIPCDEPYKYVRQGSIANSDLKTYDLGNLWLSTTYGDSSICGELYVNFTVELRKPSLASPITGILNTSIPSGANPLAGAVITGISPITVLNTTKTKLTVGGEYLITTIVRGTTITGVGTPVSSDGLIGDVGLPAIGGTTAIKCFKYRAQAGDTLSWASYVAAATWTNLEVIFTRAEYDVLF